MDAGLAKLLNSSVGTSTLKALDAILKTDNTTIANNAADRIFNNLKNSTKLVGSDDVLFAYNGSWTALSASSDAWYGSKYSGSATRSYLQFNTSGTVTLKTTQKGTDSDGPQNYKYRVTDSAGNVITEGSAAIAYESTAEISCNVNVTAGTKYKFEIVGHVDGGYNNEENLLVCGKTIMFAPSVTLTT